ncbi:class I SAM-dependent methyltransferase [Arsukibacterium sp.]|uniref:class I SAM-dependent DNA methyltransferase n=1 Tax=Arsukibacterium sp. TaxID=1977258 RepID=UPI00299E72B4|nr:class I SAM-dependent methyltransferase [Arsukibacterium sp.]MDX1677258.1 class I SAM-dependent methyltransferase [Arsukibacterium sp.]
MTDINLKQQLDLLSSHYNTLADTYGYSPHAVQQSSYETQERRLQILLEGFTDFKNKKILDFGCGTGHLFRLLQQRGFAGEYVGYDISAGLINLARENNEDGRFELRNIFEQPPEEKFDLVFISGVFNNDIGQNESFLQSVLKILFAVTEEGIAFNCLSTFVDFKADGLFYFNPCQVFEFCKEQLTPCVNLRHDYEIKPGVVPFEFSCYLRKSPHAVRKNNYD